MKLGSNNISSIYLGGNAVQSVYLGSNLVWTSFTGLLDEYPNAAAAYSLRKLRSAYNGSAIRVRRSSDNTEQDIGFVNNELDTSSLTSFCSGTNGFVTTWYDQSGNGIDATQTTAANQPQIVSSGSVININSKPSLKFDGSNDFLDINYKPTTNIITVQSVQKINTATGVSIGISEPVPQLYFQWINTSTTFANYYNGLGNNTTFFSDQILHQFYMGSSGGGFYQNSVLTVSRTQGSATPSTYNINIGRWSGGSGYSDCNHQEFILWQSNLQSNNNAISTNINDFYSIY